MPESVKFKLCVLMHCCLTGAAPQYLTELAVPVASTARCYLLILSCLQLAVQPSDVGQEMRVLLQLTEHINGTGRNVTTSLPSLYQLTKELLKRNLMLVNTVRGNCKEVTINVAGHEAKCL